jgi:uncharacterized protein (TIGR02246 family)
MANNNPLGIEGLDAVAFDDQPAITATLAALLSGFAARNADQLDGIYTDDADWVNAFGSVKRGNREIVDYLRGLFTDENFNDGQLVNGPHTSIKRLSDDIVVASTHLQVAGQGLVDGGTIDLRDNHSVHILQRQADGAWQIASEMFSDSNTDQSYVNHS